MATGQNGFANWLKSRSGLAFIGFAAIAGFFLWTEHRAHLLGALPYLIFLLCPLMHLFHGHGNHGGGDDEHKGRIKAAL